MRILTIGTAMATGLAAMTAAAIAAGNAAWGAGFAQTMRRLEDASAQQATSLPVHVSADEVAALPAAVARYFRFALAPGQRPIACARFSQTGTMRAGPADPWKAFTAVEVFTTQPAGFVWDATAMMPLIPLRIRDAYVAGTAVSQSKIAAIIPVGKLAGTPQVASSCLTRYLAEAAWLPTALLPSSGVTWNRLDDDHARATLTDSGTTVSVDVEFARAGEIVRVSTMRFRDVGSGRPPVLTRWTGRYAKYERIGGMMIPTEAEVFWSPPEGEFAVWRGRITSARYGFGGAPTAQLPGCERVFAPCSRVAPVPASTMGPWNQHATSRFPRRSPSSSGWAV